MATRSNLTIVDLVFLIRIKKKVCAPAQKFSPKEKLSLYRMCELVKNIANH